MLSSTLIVCFCPLLSAFCPLPSLSAYRTFKGSDPHLLQTERQARPEVDSFTQAATYTESGTGLLGAMIIITRGNEL